MSENPPPNIKNKTADKKPETFQDEVHKAKDLELRTAILQKEIERREKYEVELKASGEKILKEIQRRKSLEKNMINLMERDRKDVGRTLHDEVGQLLATIHMELDLLKRDATLNPSEVKKAVEKIQHRLKDSGRHIRDISRWLRSDILERLGLEAALRDLLQMLKLDCKTRVNVRIRKIPENLNSATGLAIFRIVQEAITNILRHASAKTVFVTVVNKGGGIAISVEDDGIGFVCNENENKGKGEQPLGLIIMKERAAQVGGRLWIESSPGKGTQVLAEIPVE
jgi:signal transduction histidine kinase